MRRRTGVLISTSFNLRDQVGSYHIVDLPSGNVIISKKFWSTASSDNVMAFLAICAMLEQSSSSLSESTNYCCNNVAISWATKKVCNSKTLDRETRKLVREGLILLKANNFSEEIKFWRSRCKKPMASLFFPKETGDEFFDWYQTMF